VGVLLGARSLTPNLKESPRPAWIGGCTAGTQGSDASFADMAGGAADVAGIGESTISFAVVLCGAG